MDSRSVKVITTADDALAQSIDVGAKPAGLAITPDGTRLVVAAGGASEALIVDTSNDTVLKHVAVAAAHAACISADGRYAYVGSQATPPAIVELTITGDTLPRSLPVDKAPRMLSCTPNKVYFTAVGLDALEVLDLDTGKLETPIATGASPHDVRTSADGKFELLVSQTAGDLEFIDAARESVVGKVATGKLAHWITPFDDGSGAYVTDEGDNNVVTVDFATRSVTSTIPIGNGPRKMALQP